MEDSPLSIRMLGVWEVRVGGQPLPGGRAHSMEWLLALLVLRHGRDVSRSWLAGTLWPDSSEANGLFYLRRTLVELRQALGSEAARLRSPSRATLALELTGAEVDVVAFDAAIAAGDERSMQVAVSLHRGPLLEGCVEEWVLPERASREEACLRALEALAGGAAARGDPAAALGYLAQAAALDPLRDSVQRRRMEALAASGDLPAALHTYREHRLRLHRELNAEPDPETTQLFQELRSGTRSVRREGVIREGIKSEPAATSPHQVIRSETREAGDGHHLLTPSSPSPAARVPALTASLPRPLTALIGREQEVQAVVERVFAARLVTLTGGGGVGKTRLAIQAAAELAADFPDGVAFIELAALADPALLPGHAAAALGMREAEAAGGEPAALVPALCAWLTRHPVLLVLDNCEHLLEAAAALVHALLEACPDLRILATSRQRLGITGEVVRRVPSLTVPGPERLPADEERAVEAVLSYPAAQLFVERAAAAHAEFQVENRAAAEAVAQICGRLDGIPLALELAAARVGLLTLPQIAARLDDRFRLLTGGSRVALPRQQTLRALIDWSYELLPGAERTLLCRLSVFAGGWTLEAAEAICGDCGLRIADCGLPAKAPDQMSSSLSPIHDPQSAIRNDEVLDLLCALEEKSLVLVELREGAIRYRMLETVREYAREKLEASGELAAIRDRHRDWYLQLAVGAEPELSGMRARECLDRLEREHDNLRAALQWSLEAGQGEPAQRLAGALVPFWELRRDLSEGRQALAAILSLPEMAAADAQRARILYGAGLLARTQEDHAAARAYWTEALAIWRQLSDRRGMAEVLASLSDVEDPTTNRAAATALLEESLSLWRELEDRAGQARSLGLLARISTEQEALPAARAMYEDALALNRELGNLRGQVADLTGLAYLAMAQGDLPVASAALEEVLAIQRELGDRWSTASTLFYLGRIAFDRGDYGAARRLWEETLALDREKMGEGGYVDLCLGWLLAVDGRFETARESYEAFVEKERRTSSQTDVPDGLIALGDLALQAGDEATAQARYEESLAIYRDRDADSDWGRITLPYVLWHLARRRGDLAAAQSLHEEMLLLHQSLEGHPRVGWLLHYRGMMARCEGNYEDARSLHGQSAALFGELGQWKGLAACLEAEAGLAAAQGQMVRAARLCGAAAALRDRAGQFRIPIDRADYEATVAAVRAALDEAAIAAAWAEGQAMSLDEAAAYALEGTC